MKIYAWILALSFFGFLYSFSKKEEDKFHAIVKVFQPPHTYTLLDTTILGWKMSIAYDATNVDSNWMIFSMLGEGQLTHNQYSDNYVFGPLHMLALGWNGGIPVGGGTIYPVYVTSLAGGISDPINPSTMKPKIDYLIQRFKVKKKGIGMTGLSQGAKLIEQFVGYQATAGDYSYGQLVQAIVCIEAQPPKTTYNASPVYPGNMQDYARHGGHDGLGGYVFGWDNTGDGGRDMTNWIPKCNTANAGHAWLFRGCYGNCVHDAFDSIYNWFNVNYSLTNTHVTSIFTGTALNMNIYRWMVTKMDTSLGGPVHQAPTANAGADQNITLPTSTVTLDGTNSFVNGDATSITTYAWVKTSGPSTVTITSPSSATPTVTGLIQGTYVFTLTVTDNNGLTNSDGVQITVLPAANIPPVANAGPDQSITQPASSVTCAGSGTDADGTITAHVWAQASGPSATITTPSSYTSTITGLTVGTYVFTLTVTDNNGAQNSDNFQVIVNPNTTGLERFYKTSIVRQQGFYDSTWNRWRRDSSSTFKPRRTTGEQDGITVSFSTPIDTVKDNGATYGSGQAGLDTLGIPFQAIREVTYSSVWIIYTFGGLDPTQLYSLTFLSSRKGTTQVNNTTFKLDQSTDTANISVINNYRTMAQFTNVSPNSSGVISGKATPTAGSSSVYINGFILKLQGAAENSAPQAFAGPDQLITLPTDSVLVQGAATDVNQGDTLTYLWSLVGPGSPVITLPDSLRTQFKNLSVGTYTATLTVHDNHGASGSDQLTIQVTSNTGPVTIVTTPYRIIPLAQFNGYGPTQTRDTTFATLACSPGPNVNSVTWTKVSGPSVTFQNANALSTRVWDLVPGEYLFKVVARNLTDSNTAFAQILVRDYQTINEHGFRAGGGIGHHLTMTSTLDLIKTNLWQQQALLGDTILGDDTVYIPTNPNNGHIIRNLTIGGLSGVRGHYIHIVPEDSTVTCQTVRFGYPTDSSILTFCSIDGSVNKRGIKYGFSLKYASLGPNLGLAYYIGAYDSLNFWYVHNAATGFFIKNDQDSNRKVTLWNNIRFYGMVLYKCFIDATYNGEGLYGGNTDPDGLHNNSTSALKSTRMDTFSVIGCTIRGTFRDGIQVVTSQVINENNNWFYNIGTNNEATQRFNMDAGGAYKVRMSYNFSYLGRDGFGDLAHGDNEIDHNYIGRDRTFGVGGVSAGIQYFPEDFGTMTGSALIEYKNQDSGTARIHDNIIEGIESGAYGIRVYDPRIALSKNHPTTVYNNFIIDTLGQTLSTLIQNVSGSQYNTGNTLFTSRPLQVVDMSTELIGPKFLLYWPQDNTSAIFTESADAYAWYYNKLHPTNDPHHIRISGRPRFKNN